MLLLFYLSIFLLPFTTGATAVSKRTERTVRELQHLKIRAAALNIRQNGELDFCFGENAICSISNQLSRECDKFENQRAERNTCLCNNGFVAVREACVWCQDAWKISRLASVNERNTALCISFSASIAPIPASVIAQQSLRNATYTGLRLEEATIRETSASTTLDSSRTTTKDSQGSGTTTRSASRIFPAFSESRTRTQDGGGSFSEPTGPTRTGVVGSLSTSAAALTLKAPQRAIPAAITFMIFTFVGTIFQ